MGPFFCFMVQRFSQQWGVWFNNAIFAFSIWTNSRGYKNSEKLMSHAWRLLMPVYSTFFTLKDSSAHQRYMWVPSTSVTLLEVVKMNCARARIGNLCNIFSEKKLITEHTCDYCRLEFTEILWHFHGQLQPQSAAPFASFMSTNLSVYSSCWISNWTIPSTTHRKQLAINQSLLLMGPAKTSCQFTALHSCVLKSCRDLPNPPQTNFKCHTGQIFTGTSTDCTVTKAVTTFLEGEYLPSSTQIARAAMMMMCRFGENFYLSAPYSAITTPAL